MKQLIDPQLALDIVCNSKVIAYDTETDGLEHTSVIVGYVVTDYSASVYVPVRHEGGGNIPNSAKFETALAAAFMERARLDYRTVGHNFGFDLRKSLQRFITITGPLEDTMINESLIDDTTRGYGLEECCIRRGVTPKKGEELYRLLAERFGGIPDRKQMGNYWRLPGDDPTVVDYATGDGVSTLELWEAQQPILDAEELRVPWQLECDLLHYLARMNIRGLKVDMDYAEKVEEIVKKRLADAQSKFSPGFNPRSPKEVEALYRLNGFQDTDFDRTAAGKPSFTEKWLETTEIGKAILSVRQIEKARDSFIIPLVTTKNHNGRVHPILNQSKSDDFGVKGARLSCSDPNMQAFPKRNKTVGKMVRPLICADFDWLFEEGDFKQQEPRFFTHYSEEPSLIEGYRSGKMDIHDIADSYFHLGRDISKRLGLGILTGMQKKSLAGHMRWSIAEADAAIQKFLWDAFPNIRQFQADAKATFLARGFVKSILGRKARMESREFAYKAVSRVIQNSGGDHMKTALKRACEYEDAHPDKINILLTIHDSTIWQRDPGHDISELRRSIEGVAHEPAFDLLVPIPIDIGSGKHWGTASYGPYDVFA